MPEMPEVEIVKQGLEDMIKGKTIQTVHASYDRIVDREISLEDWVQQIKGETFNGFRRRGKFLVFELTHWLLISHLRMEGKYFFFSKAEIPEKVDKHTHIVFEFTDGSQLHYNDVRKFGRMQLIAPEEEAIYFKRRVGPEPTDVEFDLTYFIDRLSRTRRAIKTTLLDQTIVAGLGNIYADEVLFKAGIHPQRPAKTLSMPEATTLRQAIISILEAATVAGGTTVRTYENTLGESGTYQQHLKVYGRQQKPCVNCGHLIDKIQLNGRGTHFCSQCQPLTESE